MYYINSDITARALGAPRARAHQVASPDASIGPSRLARRSPVALTGLFDRPSRPKIARRGLFDRLGRPKWLEKRSEERFWSHLGRFGVSQRVDFGDFSVAFRSSGPTCSNKSRHAKNLQKPM